EAVVRGGATARLLPSTIVRNQSYGTSRTERAVRNLWGGIGVGRSGAGAGGVFGADEFAMAEMDQIRDLANDVFLIFVQIAIRVGDAPHMRDQVELLLEDAMLIHQLGKAIHGCGLGALVL